MSKEPADESAVKLHSYSLKNAAADERAAAFGTDEVSALPIQITLRGRAFMVCSFDPTITIGNVQLKDFEIMSDGCTIVGYLYEIPEDGSVITIDYGAGERSELPERFSLKKLTRAGDENA